MKACVLRASAGSALDVAGLSVAERTRRALVRAGFSRADLGSAPHGTHTLFLASDAVIEPEALQALVAAAVEGSGAISAGNAIEKPAALLVPASAREAAALSHADELGAFAARLREQGCLRLTPTGDAICQRVCNSGDAARLERRLLAALAQPTDGFFARHFDRRLSSRLSPALVRLGVTPNAITLVATLVGLIGAACLATQPQALQIVGALLFIVSTIFDGCDGEVARLSFTSSELGRRLDLMGDNVVNGSVFVAIGWSAWRGHSGATMSLLVWITLGGFVLATVAGFAFSRWIDRSGRKAQMHDWYESLASRDFAYLILLLAALGRLHWFVWLAAFGSYAFVGLLAVIRVRTGRSPAPTAAERQWA